MGTHDEIFQSDRPIVQCLIFAQVNLRFCQISITSVPLKPTTGQTVLLQVGYRGKILNINWYRGRGTANVINILTYSPGSEYNSTPGPQYSGREIVLDDGSLQISNILTNYSGFYTLQLTIPEDYLLEVVELTVDCK
ncbi:hypothetical protein GDO86_000618 [Hymenochirus boettgeri]|uniref:Immunoglobulin V-set domain-containing protein n=1 Tax=Hymenochirus boettgeri TaxID=247094 RepID=A0A8T2KA86_9PIPI|nr:hypothetical protein GDO86_000618 [Hymenochirus boettgeri]